LGWDIVRAPCFIRRSANADHSRRRTRPHSGSGLRRSITSGYWATSEPNRANPSWVPGESSSGSRSAAIRRRVSAGADGRDSIQGAGSSSWQPSEQIGSDYWSLSGGVSRSAPRLSLEGSGEQLVFESSTIDVEALPAEDTSWIVPVLPAGEHRPRPPRHGSRSCRRLPSMQRQLDPAPCLKWISLSLPLKSRT
jgi:hypothetical protein